MPDFIFPWHEPWFLLPVLIVGYLLIAGIVAGAVQVAFQVNTRREPDRFPAFIAGVFWPISLPGLVIYGIGRAVEWMFRNNGNKK